MNLLSMNPQNPQSWSNSSRLTECARVCVCVCVCVCARAFVRDLVKNGVVCPGVDAELAALHPRKLLFTVSEMRTADSWLRRRPQQPGKIRGLI